MSDNNTNSTISYGSDGMYYLPEGLPQDQGVWVTSADYPGTEHETFLVMPSATCVDIRIKDGKITWVGCLCGDCEDDELEWEADHPDRIDVMEREADLVQACRVFLERHPDGRVLTPIAP